MKVIGLNSRKNEKTVFRDVKDAAERTKIDIVVIIRCIETGQTCNGWSFENF